MGNQVLDDALGGAGQVFNKIQPLAVFNCLSCSFDLTQDVHDVESRRLVWTFRNGGPQYVDPGRVVVVVVDLEPQDFLLVFVLERELELELKKLKSRSLDATLILICDQLNL